MCHTIYTVNLPCIYGVYSPLYPILPSACMQQPYNLAAMCVQYGWQTTNGPLWQFVMPAVGTAPVCRGWFYRRSSKRRGSMPCQRASAGTTAFPARRRDVLLASINLKPVMCWPTLTYRCGIAIERIITGIAAVARLPTNHACAAAARRHCSGLVGQCMYAAMTCLISSQLNLPFSFPPANRASGVYALPVKQQHSACLP